MTNNAIASIGDAIAGNERLVVLPQSEFNRVKKHIHSGRIFAGYDEVKVGGKKHRVPVYQLLGKWADDLDKIVEEGMREYKEGKYFAAPSLKSFYVAEIFR